MLFKYLRASLILLFFPTASYADYTFQENCSASYGYGTSVCHAVGYQFMTIVGSTCESVGGGGSGVTTFTCSQVQPSSCQSPMTWDSDTQTCNEPPLSCEPFGTLQADGTCSVSGGNNEENCENPLGYIEGIFYCGDAHDECAANGGSLGSVNGEMRCVPNDSGPPICDSGGLVTLVEEGYVCESPTDNQNGTDNDDPSPENANAGASPNTKVDPLKPDSATPPSARTSTDPIALAQGSLTESQEQTKEQRKQTNQLGDVNKELDNITGKTDRIGDILEVQGQARVMPTHTLNTARSVGQVFTNFNSNVDNIPLVQAFGNFADIFGSGGGQCPPLSIDLAGTIIGEDVSTDIHCDLFDSVGDIINTCMLCVFAFTAF